ncbi:GNAT family N-acetyltransferase [Vibrio aquimaris]|uniref:Acetyltransferase (GNAT) family protein n=1 Tax=Vibrio aquimaris TaxID=2587862 RepID=A0A5P9CS14_9VIBR|nr:GNAT family N-acetyltransferase [Vibrio aquimaris]QFT28731.1 Acetyltransferase (GNAT) family protein [Vibrio aquimaris]
MKFISEKHGEVSAINLIHYPEYFSLFAQWAESEWGYVRNKGVEFRTELFKQYIESDGIPEMYGLFIQDSPVGMFAIEHCESQDNTLFLNYLYITPKYRSANIGTKTVELAKQICRTYQADFMQLTTLETSMNAYYENLGGHIIGKEYFYTYPATRMEIQL